MKTAIIDVGGGMRGVYAAGVLDRCIDDGVSVDLGIGISAGSANIGAFLSGQRGRNRRFYTVYAQRPQYMGIGNFLKKRSFFDMDYVYGTLSNSDGEDPFDYDALLRNPAEFLVVACDAETGETAYFTKDAFQPDDYAPFKASCAIPFVCKPYPVHGRLYFDGALADTVPIEKAFSLGCERVVLILTKPRSVRRTPKGDERIARLIRKTHPKAAERLLGRAARYNDGVALAERYETEGRVLIVSPDDTCGVDTLVGDSDKLNRLYEKGYEDGAKVRPFLQSPLR